MKFIDICSGIGGFRSALERHGHECVAFAEIDKFAKQSYKAIYNTENEEELDDITSVTDEHFRLYRGQVDLITGGFPCQSFSIAGNRRGFEDTRGTIFFHIARAIKEIQPSYVLLENVKGLLSHDKGRTYGTIVQALDELGYFIEWGLFNSKYWGVPQNRERVYILVTRKDVWKEPKLFNLLKQQTSVDTRLVDILETDVDESYYLSEEKTKKLTLKEDLSGRLNHYDYRDVDSVHSVNKVSPTLNTMQGGDRQPKIAIREATKQGYGVVMGGDFNVEKIERDTFEILQALQKEIGEKEIAKWRSRILDTFQQEEILRQDVYEKGLDIEQNEKKLERKEQSCERKNENRTFDGQKVLRKMPINKEFRCSSHGRESIQQFARELTSIMQKLSHETSQEKNLYHLRETTQGIRLLRKTLSEIQEIWGSSLHEIQTIRIRKLVPIETWRLQGFSDEQFYKAKNSGVSNSQLYKQAGNAVTVNVVDAIVGEFE